MLARDKKQWVKEIGQILDHYFPHPEIPLHHKDPFTLLISVLLSAQCTDARVNQVTPHLFVKASTPEQMAVLSEEEIFECIRSCGLARNKAKAIKALSRILLERYGGIVPDSLEELESLPGVGHKTASVVMVQAFHKPAFPVDTHIMRCAVRWGLSDSSQVKEVERALKEAFPKKDWGKRHLQIILFARTYCQARRHDVHTCPICCLSSRQRAQLDVR